MYRFFNFMGTDSDNSNRTESYQNQELPKFENDSFSLHENFRDPFLGGTRLANIAQNSKGMAHRAAPNVVRVPNTQATISSVPFPEVQHLGIVSNGSSGNKAHVIKIDGNQYMISKTGKYGNLEVIELTKDYIKLKFNNEIKIFRP